MDLPLSLLEDITNGFSHDQQIGSGGFAVLYKGILGKVTIAVKKLSKTFDNHEKQFHEEVSCLMKAKHKNIVRFLGYCSDTRGKMVAFEGKLVMADVRQRLLCFEYLPRGSLDKYIAGSSYVLQWKESYQIIKEICEGLHYLHVERRIVHLDLKPTNILLDCNMVPKIADFGLSRRFCEKQSQILTAEVKGTLGYMAPEFVNNGQITFKSDIYSLGIIITEILTRQRGYRDVEDDCRMEVGTILMKRYEIGRLIAQGDLAKVYYAQNLTSEQDVAIKMIDKDKVSSVELMVRIKREMTLMNLLGHPNVLKLVEVMASKSKLYFVLEYPKGGDLSTKIVTGGLHEDAARKYFRQLISAVEYCHSQGVYHRNLNLENILLDENGNLKISDFGLSVLPGSREDGLFHYPCGTPAYVAPEVLSWRGYAGAKVDIWSCGVILFVLVAGYLPFQDPSTRASVSSIKASAWYRNHIEVKACKGEATTSETTECSMLSKGKTKCSNSVGNQAPSSFTHSNAVGVISLSVKFYLSNLSEKKYGLWENKFTARLPAETLFARINELAEQLKLKVKKKENGILKLVASEEGMGRLELDAEVFELAPSFLLVEIKITNGDKEYELQMKVKDAVRLIFKDMVWAWQDDSHSQQPQFTLFR
ncbi:CBL-interacting protein kinase 26 [Hordeum vulgare]|nr:CBL-interacting protein kinase 26 [Hordeum vulgare]